jgi:hypothetical protein
MVGIVVESRLASSGKANLKYGFILQFFQACINMTTQGVDGHEFLSKRQGYFFFCGLRLHVEKLV